MFAENSVNSKIARRSLFFSTLSVIVPFRNGSAKEKSYSQPKSAEINSLLRQWSSSLNHIITFDSNIHTDLLENNVADRYESFIAVFEVAGLEANTVDLTSDNLQKVTELEIRNEDEEDEIIYR